MFISKQNTLSLFAAAGLCLAGFLGPHPAAQAADSSTLTLEPKGKWLVNRVMQPEAAQTAYCLMVRPFEQNLVLTYAQRPGGDYSLALDIRDGRRFAPNGTHPVTLQVGNGHLRSFSLTPSSQTAFVMELGGDARIDRALAEVPTIKISLDEEKYVFRTDGWAAARKELQACLGGTAPKTAAAPNQPRRPAQATKGNANIKDSRNNKNDRVARADQAKSSPVTVAEFSPPRSEGLLSLLNEKGVAQGNQFTAEKRVENPAETKMEKATNIKPQPVTEKSSAIKNNSAGSGARASTNAQPANTQPANAQATAAFEKISSENEFLRQKLAQLKNAAQQNKSNMSGANAADHKNMRAEVEVLNQKIKQIEREKANLEAQQKKLSLQRGDDATALEKEIAELRKKNMAMTKAIERARLEKENSSLSGAPVDLETQKLVTRYNESLREIRRLGAVLQDEKQSCNAEKNELEKMLFDPALTSQAQRQRLASLQQSVGSLEQKLGEQETACRARVEQVTSLSDQKLQKLALLVKEASGQIKAQEQKNEVQKSLIAGLEKQVEAERQKVGQAKNQQEQEVALLKQRLEAEIALGKQKEDKIASLEKASSLSSEEIQAQEELIAGLEKQLASEKEEVGQVQQELLAKLEESQSYVREREGEISSLEETLALIRAEFKLQQSATGDMQGLIDAVREKEKQIAALGISLSLADEESDAQAELIASLEQQIENVRQESREERLAILSQKDDETRRSRGEIEGLRRKVEDLSISLNAKNQLLLTSEAELAQKDDAGEKFRSEIEDLRRKVEELSIALNTKNQLLLASEAALKERDQKIATLMGRPDVPPEFTAKYENVSGVLTATKTENDVLKQEIEDFRARYADLQKKVDLQHEEYTESVKEKELLARQNELLARQNEVSKKEAQVLAAESKISGEQKEGLLAETQRLKVQMGEIYAYQKAAEERISALEHENASLRQQVANAQNAAIAARASASAQETRRMAFQAPQFDQYQRTSQYPRFYNQQAGSSYQVAQRLSATEPAAQGNYQFTRRTEAQPAVEAETIDVPQGFPKSSVHRLGIILKQAGVRLQRPVQKSLRPRSAEVEELSWEAERTAGTSEVRDIDNTGQFNQFVSEYVAHAKAQCKGEFAAMPIRAEGVLATNDMACIAPGKERTSSVVFYSDGLKFYAISHQGSTETMNTAMDIRERLSAYFAGEQFYN